MGSREMPLTTNDQSNADQIIREQIKNCIHETDFGFLGEKYRGKVRDCYINARKKIRYIITTDRLTAFDRYIASIPFKGEVLNGIATRFFRSCSDIIENHLIDVPHKNVSVTKECRRLDVEVIVRNYMCGSLWRTYQQGQNIFQLPDGIKEFQKFDTPVITPTTKAPIGEHDTFITVKEVLSRNLVTSKEWEFVKEAVLNVFKRGSEIARKNGLIMADSKYEFGVYENKIILIDEIHTFDCTRYWIESSYEENIKNSRPPQMLDKEKIRQWLIQQGYMGEGNVPFISEDKIVEISKHYLDSYRLLTGEEYILSLSNPVQEVKSLLG